MDRAEMIERLEKATGPDKHLDWEIYQFAAYTLGDSYGLQSYTSSLDCTVALVGRLLPGWTWYVGNGENGAGDDGSVAGIYPPKEPSKASKGDHATTAIALLIALLKATQ